MRLESSGNANEVLEDVRGLQADGQQRVQIEVDLTHSSSSNGPLVLRRCRDAVPNCISLPAAWRNMMKAGTC